MLEERLRWGIFKWAVIHHFITRPYLSAPSWPAQRGLPPWRHRIRTVDVLSEAGFARVFANRDPMSESSTSLVHLPATIS